MTDLTIHTALVARLAAAAESDLYTLYPADEIDRLTARVSELEAAFEIIQRSENHD